MKHTIIDIADLDCIYLTYDEPQKEEFWIKIQNMVPWAKRVDGIKGSDAAHKAAAAASETERFILIDGDNMPDPEFFNLQLHLDEVSSKAVFRWRARNYINGLMYGNGGMSCWTKTFVNNMKTHEASDGRHETLVEFCFDEYYWPMHDCYSVTYPNVTPFQAWRAGFREGVKMILNRGKLPTLPEFESMVHKRNLDNLTIWQNVGADVENGNWAMLGAQQGTWYALLGEWDYRKVQDFAELEVIWNKTKDAATVNYGSILKQKLGLPMPQYNAEGSAFFKHHYKSNFHNMGPMVKEMDVIRRQEGW
jgi:hypothetical protein